MCEPTLALTAVTAVVGFIGSQQDASANNAAQDRRYAAVTKEADAAFFVGADAQNDELRQEQETASDKALNASIQARQAAATAQASAASSGVSGVSLNALLGDYERGLHGYMESLATGLDRATAGAQRNKTSLNATRESRINGAAPNYVSGQSIFEPLSKIAGAGISAYDADPTVFTPTLPA
jgi:hypothetical protein